MLMDKTTEMVAHMIGIFHTSVEEVRLREVYDKFTALKKEAMDAEAIGIVDVNFKTGYRLGEFSPSVKYKVPFVEEGTSSPIFPLHTPTGFYIPGIWGGKLKFDLPQFYPPFFWGGGGKAKFTLEPPASVIVVTLQSNYLYDDDLLIQGDGTTVFTDPTELLEDLQQYQVVAQAIEMPLDAQELLTGDDLKTDAIELHGRLGAVEGSTITGLSATVLHGAEALGQHLNGELVEELEALADVLPAHHQPDAAEDETGVSSVEDSDHEWPDPFEGLDNDGATSEDFAIELGHTVVAGGNSMVNEVSIHSAWLDAPLMAVVGDVVNMQVIAQVNVMINQSYGASWEQSGSTVLNGAGMSFASSAPADEDGEEAAPIPAGGGLPSDWIVTRIEGDVVSLNHINQYSFQTDHDRAELTFTSTNTFIGLGDNTVYNQINLGELGFGYDLIIIGGSMITANWISQTNVLIDNDKVTFAGGNKAAVGLGDNLLFNKAIINGTGVDMHEKMSTSMAGIADKFGKKTKDKDEDEDTEGVADMDVGFQNDPSYSPVFEGVDVLRVLYVEGDLALINWIKQTNILGDSDQVHLAMDNLAEETGAQVHVTAGSNAVVNLATINEYGIDSTIQVGGDVYDDALLYQAELIDTEADPLGVSLEGLASEAVAFLAEDMLAPEIGQEEDSIVPTAPEDTSSPDVMQTMLA